MPVIQPVLETDTNTYIYMIIVGKSMPIDNYEQYERVINQITGILYIYIRNQELFDFLIFLFGVCVWLFMTICF